MDLKSSCPLRRRFLPTQDLSPRSRQNSLLRRAGARCRVNLRRWTLPWNRRSLNRSSNRVLLEKSLSCRRSTMTDIPTSCSVPCYYLQALALKRWSSTHNRPRPLCVLNRHRKSVSSWNTMKKTTCRNILVPHQDNLYSMWWAHQIMEKEDAVSIQKFFARCPMIEHLAKIIFLMSGEKWASGCKNSWQFNHLFW